MVGVPIPSDNNPSYAAISSLNKPTAGFGFRSTTVFPPDIVILGTQWRVLLECGDPTWQVFKQEFEMEAKSHRLAETPLLVELLAYWRYSSST